MRHIIGCLVCLALAFVTHMFERSGDAITGSCLFIMSCCFMYLFVVIFRDFLKQRREYLDYRVNRRLSVRL